jgi:hypothetical protein
MASANEKGVILSAFLDASGRRWMSEDVQMVPRGGIEPPTRGFSVVPDSSSIRRALSHLVALVIDPLEKQPLRAAHAISSHLTQARTSL